MMINFGAQATESASGPLPFQTASGPPPVTALRQGVMAPAYQKSGRRTASSTALEPNSIETIGKSLEFLA